MYIEKPCWLAELAIYFPHYYLIYILGKVTDKNLEIYPSSWL